MSSPVMAVSHYPAEQRHQTAHHIGQCADTPNLYFFCLFFRFVHKKHFLHDEKWGKYCLKLSFSSQFHDLFTCFSGFFFNSVYFNALVGFFIIFCLGYVGKKTKELANGHHQPAKRVPVRQQHPLQLPVPRHLLPEISAEGSRQWRGRMPAPASP